MQRIAIHGKPVDKASQDAVEGVLKLLKLSGKEVILSADFRKTNHPYLDLGSFNTYPNRLSSKDADAVITLGGDGTLLEVLTHVGNSEIPLLGINTGRLGFLATINKERVEEAITSLFDRQYEFDFRTLVALENDDLFQEAPFALNEFAILRRDTSSMIVVRCAINGEHLNTYWADGLMVSTPTGSTGYSLSCGGPVIMPETQNFLVTPVSPHNLNVRPLLIPDDSKLSFTIASRDRSCLLSLDSRSRTVSPENLELTVSKAKFRAVLIKLSGESFLDTLRSKLSWGFDKRN